MKGHEPQPTKSAQMTVGEKQDEGNDSAAVASNTASSTTRVRKLFSYTQIFFFALTFMNSWEAMGTNIGIIFYNGGPRAMVWGFFIVIPGALCQAASLAELASVQPIAGAQYVWTHYYAPRRYQRGITWCQGWITWFAWIAMTAGMAVVTESITTTLITVSYPTYEAKAWHSLLIIYALLITIGLINQYAFWIIPWVELVCGILHNVLFVAFAAVLCSMGQRRRKDSISCRM